jgi:diaminohydroxyphosphoribosylaminopyrimidine deaminase/5-amino-6-(5-phosphoribosylamino)uracil reductase
VSDERFMRRALELAESGRYSVSPNPMVGCVLVRDGAIIGEGWHRRAGEAHAEVEALATCADASGATLYVTLEPCCHQGRTPPCTDAVIAARVRRVVIAMRDPHDVVDGRGIGRLRDAGIDVEVGLLEAEARRLNEKFIWSVTQKSPFVLLKAAITLDAKLATVARESQWITSEAARERSLLLREEYDAIAVGSGTVEADNPRLTRRLGLNRSVVPWTRVVFDGAASAPPHAQIFRDGERTLLFTSRPERYEPSSGLEIIEIGASADIAQILGDLHARGITSLLVEGGSQIHSQMIRRGLWQKMVMFVAPMIVGGSDAPSLFAGDGVPRLTDAYRFRFDRAEMVGGDLMIVGYAV